MSKLVLLGTALTALAGGTAAQAQFRLDYSASAQRAQYNARVNPQQDKDKINNGALRPMSPLGGSTGAPNAKPAGPATPMTAYAGVAASGIDRPGVGVTGSVGSDFSVDDPNRPRGTLKPKTIKPGVQPRN